MIKEIIWNSSLLFFGIFLVLAFTIKTMNPTEIQEDWESREKVKLTFKNGEEEHTIYPKVHDDWADMQGLLKYVNNRILAPVDYQFSTELEEIFL